MFTDLVEFEDSTQNTNVLLIDLVEPDVKHEVKNEMGTPSKDAHDCLEAMVVEDPYFETDDNSHYRHLETFRRILESPVGFLASTCLIASTRSLY